MNARSRDRQEAVRKAYQFFREQYEADTAFTVQDLMSATGWSKSSVDTYITKQFRELLQRIRGEIRVRPEIQQFTEDRFLELATQKRQIYTSYRTVKYQEVVTYEFLLPLTREDQLRKALDDLFYTDTIRQRLNEVGLSQLTQWISRNGGELDKDYLDRICTLVSALFGGYSISLVSGRYRAAMLANRNEAAQMLAADQRYLIDETTAAVRFIIPITSTRTEDPQNTDILNLGGATLEPQVAEEISLVHALFFNLFVEAVVRRIKGEEEIWLVEEAGRTRSLYVWERA